MINNLPIPKFMLSFYGYLKKDSLLLYKRKKYLYTFILVPVVIALLFLLALSPKGYVLKMSVCDLDNTELSNSALSDLPNFDISLVQKENCTEVIKQKIINKETDMGVVIPAGFESNIKNLKQSKLIVYYDNTDIALANLLAWKVDVALYPFEKQIINSINSELKSKITAIRENTELIKEVASYSEITKRKFNEIDKELANVQEMETEFLVNPLWTDHQPVYDEKIGKKAGIVFVFPIIALFVVLMLASTSVIYDKTNGFITRVKSSTSPLIYLLAKMAFFFLVVCLQFAIVLALFLFEGSRYSLDITELVKLLLSIAFVNSLLGILIGLLSENEGIAVLISLLFSMPLMLISGIFFPVQTMPALINSIAGFMPLNYQITSSKAVLLLNTQIDNLWIYISIALLAICWYLIKKKL